MSSHISPLDRPSAPSTSTSIKRSYDQFGMDHDNNHIGGSSNSENNGTSRNKRARSEGRSSDEAESASSSNSSIQTLATGPDDSFINIPNDPQPVPSASTSSITSHAPVLPLPEDDIVMLASNSSWPRSPDEDSFETALDHSVNEFERHIAALRESPPTSPPQAPPPPHTIPFISMLDFESPPSPQMQAPPSYISWSTRLQQQEQGTQERRSRSRQSMYDSQQSISQDIAELRASIRPSPPPRRPSSLGLRLPPPRFSSESRSRDPWSQGRITPPDQLSLGMLEREHTGMEVLRRRGEVDFLGEYRPLTDNFAGDRDHLPSFSRHFENIQPETTRRSSDAGNFNNVNAADGISQWPTYHVQRDATDSRMIDNAQSSWYSTRPTPSNTLMSETADQRRRRLQRRMMFNLESLVNDNDSGDEDLLSRRLDSRVWATSSQTSAERARGFPNPRRDPTPPLSSEDPLPPPPRASYERMDPMAWAQSALANAERARAFLESTRGPLSPIASHPQQQHSRSSYEPTNPARMDPMEWADSALEQARAFREGSRATSPAPEPHLPQVSRSPYEPTFRWSPSPLPLSTRHDGIDAGPVDPDGLEALRRRRRERDRLASLDVYIPPAAQDDLDRRQSPQPADAIPIPRPRIIIGRSGLLSASRPAIFRSPSPPSPPRHTRYRSPPSENTSEGHEESSRPSIYRDMNLNAYQNGPFRASLERFRDIDRMRDSLRSRLSQLDSIVDDLPSRTERERPRERVPSAAEPLRPSISRRDRGRERVPSVTDHSAFDFTLPPLESRSTRETEWSGRSTAGSSSRPHSRSPAPVSRRSTLSEAARQASELRRRPAPTTEHARFNFTGGPQRRDQNPAPSEELRDRRAEMHEMFSRRPRLEASRIDENISSARPTPTPVSVPVPDGQAQGFNQALDVLRGDGLSAQRQRQLITRFHRQRGEEPRDTSSLWGEMAQQRDVESQRRLHALRRAQGAGRRDVPAFSFGTTTAATTSRGVAGRTGTRQRSPSNSPTRGNTTEAGQTTGSRANRAMATARRAARQRMTSDFEGYVRFDYPRLDIMDMPSRRYSFRVRNMGDYVRDEDFDDSFENLINLTATMGEVKPKNTPAHVIEGLPSGLYKDWASPGCDQRCPICLDDYKPTDSILKITDCSHWMHKDCLQQWLHSANTCPVCRKRVKGKRKRTRNENETPQDPPQAGPSRRDDDDDDDDDNGGNGMTTNVRPSDSYWFTGGL